MEGKKRKRMELSLKTSKKQAIWKTADVEISGCHVETEQVLGHSKLQTKDTGCVGVKEVVDLEKGNTKHFEERERRIQLKSLLPTCQRWEDLEDLPDSKVLCPEGYVTLPCDTNHGKHKHQEENQEIREQASNYENEFDVDYTDLPKPDMAYLMSNKPSLLDVERILKESSHSNSGMGSQETSQNYSSVNRDPTISTRWKGGKNCRESASSLPEGRSKQKEMSHPSCSGNNFESVDIVDLTIDESDDNSSCVGRGSVVKEFQSRSSFAGRISGNFDGPTKHSSTLTNSFGGPSSREFAETEARKGSDSDSRFDRGKSSLQLNESKSGGDRQVKVTPCSSSSLAAGTVSSMVPNDCLTVKHMIFKRAKPITDSSATVHCTVSNKLGTVELQQSNSGCCVRSERLPVSKQNSKACQSKSRISTVIHGPKLAKETSLPDHLQSFSKERDPYLDEIGLDSGRLNGRVVERKLLEKQHSDSIPTFQSTTSRPKYSSSSYLDRSASKSKSGQDANEEYCQLVTSSRSCRPSDVNSNSFTGSTQNAACDEEQLKCCPMCQWEFPPGTRRGRIDQHISECVESGAIMDDDEDYEW